MSTAGSPAPSTPSSSQPSSPLLAPTAASSTAPSTPGAHLGEPDDADSGSERDPMDAAVGKQGEGPTLETVTEGVQAVQLQDSNTARPSLDGPLTSTPTVSSPTTPPAALPLASASTAASPPPLPRLPTVPPVSSPTQPPPLYPRATAPAGLPPRKTPAPSGGLRAGVRGAPLGAGGMKIPPSLAAKMAAMTSGSRAATPSGSSSGAASPAAGTSNSPSLTFRAPPAGGAAPAIPGRTTAAGPPPVAPRMGAGGMAGRRRMGPGLTLSGMGAGASGGSDAAVAARRASDGFGEGGMRLPGAGPAGAGSPGVKPQEGGTPFSNFRKIVDPSGRLNFGGKAVVHADGVDFSSGASFKIKMDDFDLHEELGKGNYGTVQKVWHKPTKITMALKEIRLELDDSKLKTIVTELDILHRAVSPFIIDFYGAFFIESCVYLCMEYMDGGSLELFAGCDVPEDVLSRVTGSVVKGLKFLKDELKMMHRDVKPTNVLINRKGYIKLCDFGVSGQLDRSLAKTNIGCQSYMAPERIKGESQGVPTSYTASSDVWSLGLSIIEFAVGHYPYPPETYQNVFAQLTAIVHGDPPALPDRYGGSAQDFVSQCLEKASNRRPTYAQLLEHPFLKEDEGREVDMADWVSKALEYREKNPKSTTPALA